MFLNTALSIQENCLFEGGFYGADWTGETTWLENRDLGQPDYITTFATTTHMLYAAYAAMKNGNIPVSEEDLPRFSESYPVHRK